MEQYTVDTHSLLWYVTDDSRLGSNANSVIESAENGEVNIIIPAIVLIEAVDILNKRRVIYDPTDLLNRLTQTPQFIIKDLDWEIITLFKDYAPPDPTIKVTIHDKIIIVTAQCYGSIPIITKDNKIQKVYSSTIW
jgi:PIN domain nuclease of toxin-antitoxin system